MYKMNSFEQRKREVLLKKDKSNIGKWDKRIVSLCDKINKDERYYTTSSCSGRIMILKEENKKGPGLFKFVSHELISFEEFSKKLEEIKEGDFKFKQESFILHIACRDIESARNLLDKGISSGIKRCGIISLGKNIIVELNSTERLEFPFIKDGKILVEDSFLKEVLGRSNFNLNKGWIKLKKLQKLL
jgi:tRNA wybutosine-synthesizing protein 3